MKFKLEHLIQVHERHCEFPRVSFPPVSDNYKRLYKRKPKLELVELWNQLWANPNYPFTAG